MKPLISVLVAARRAEPWLAGCIDAVLDQRLPPGWSLEILLGVDACNATLEVAKTCEDPRLQRFHFPQQVGPYVIFNTLMRHAGGDLLCRFDADDVMLDDFLESQIRACESGTDITRTWFTFTDPNLNPTDHVLAHEAYHPPGGLSTRPADGQLVFARRVWDGIGGFRAWPCGADTEFAIRARLSGYRTQIIERHLYLRRSHAASLTAHPDTNFKSQMRNRLSDITQKHEAAIMNDEMDAFVPPQCADAYRVV